jgi:hypothetical protein
MLEIMSYAVTAVTPALRGMDLSKSGAVPIRFRMVDKEPFALRANFKVVGDGSMHSLTSRSPVEAPTVAMPYSGSPAKPIPNPAKFPATDSESTAQLIIKRSRLCG